MIRHTFLIVLIACFFAGCDLQDGEHRSLELTIADSTASNPTVAIDPSSGTTFIAYTATRDGEVDVFIDRLPRGSSGPAGAIRVNDVPGDAAVHPQAPAQVALGPGGEVYVTWISQTQVEGRRFPLADIRFARSIDGGESFGPALTVGGDTGFPTSRHFHNIAIGPDGAIYIAWLDSEARDRANALQEVGHPHGSGHADGPGTELKVARSIDGGASFEPAVLVAENTCECCRTALAVGNDGTVYVAWRHLFDKNTRDMAIARSEDGGRSFSVPARVHRDDWRIDGCPHSGPSMGIDSEDRLQIVWYTGVEDRAGIYYATSTNRGETFGNARAVMEGIPVAQASLASYGAETWVAFNDPMSGSVLRRRMIPGTSEVGSRGIPGRSPAIAVASDLRTIVFVDASGLRALVER